jgi:hypothetical protein
MSELFLRRALEPSLKDWLSLIAITNWPITKESIIEKTYISENLPLPLFSKEGDSSLLQREGRRDLVFSVYTISLKIAPLMFRQPREGAQG